MSKEETSDTNPLFDNFMSKRTVILSGEIDDKSISVTGQRLLTLQTLSSESINLIIDSGGGNLDGALRLCDMITTLMRAPIRGIALGICGSAATFIMLHCTERVSTPYSRFLIHSGTRSRISIPINQTTSENLEHLLKDVKATEEMVLRLYMSRLTPRAWMETKPSDEERRLFVRKLIDRGDQRFNELMSAEEAVEVGLVTKIIEDKLDIFEE